MIETQACSRTPKNTSPTHTRRNTHRHVPKPRIIGLGLGQPNDACTIAPTHHCSMKSRQSVFRRMSETRRSSLMYVKIWTMEKLGEKTSSWQKGKHLTKIGSNVRERGDIQNSNRMNETSRKCCRQRGKKEGWCVRECVRAHTHEF